MKTAMIKVDVALNILQENRYHSKEHGKIVIYTIGPCKTYNNLELAILCKNNPNHFIYDPEKQCVYTDFFGMSFLESGSSPRFYILFLGNTKRLEGAKAEKHFDTCKKYLRRYAEIQMTDKDE